MDKAYSVESSETVPGEGMLHPVAMASILVLVLNDHWFKASFGGFWTGKISDFAGLLFFPLLLQALVEISQYMLGHWRGPSNRVLLQCIVATALFFTCLQLLPFAADIYALTLGILRWPITTLQGETGLQTIQVTADPTDLIALPFLAACWRLGRR